MPDETFLVYGMLMQLVLGYLTCSVIKMPITKVLPKVPKSTIPSPLYFSLSACLGLLDHYVTVHFTLGKGKSWLTK